MITFVRYMKRYKKVQLVFFVVRNVCLSSVCKTYKLLRVYVYESYINIKLRDISMALMIIVLIIFTVHTCVNENSIKPCSILTVFNK